MSETITDRTFDNEAPVLNTFWTSRTSSEWPLEVEARSHREAAQRFGDIAAKKDHGNSAYCKILRSLGVTPDGNQTTWQVYVGFPRRRGVRELNRYVFVFGPPDEPETN